MNHLINPVLIGMARNGIGVDHVKRAFVPGGDPSMGGAPAGGDPAAGGGMPPPPGGDPSGGGGGSSGLDAVMGALQQMQQQMQQMQAGGGGGAGGMASGAALKPKIDVNVEIMQIKNMLAKIVDHLGIHMPAQDMTATSDKLMAMAQGQSPASGGGGAGAGAGAGAIPPVDPMQGMAPAGMPGAEKMGGYRANGSAFDAVGLASGLTNNTNLASAILRMRRESK